MRRPLIWVNLSIILSFFHSMAHAQAQPPGFRVEGRYLVDRCGQRVVLRGINEMTTWSSRSGASLAEIAKTGANCVRIVAVVADKAADLDNWMNLSVKAGMIPMPELHDATGLLNKLPSLFDYWLKPEIVAVLKKHESHLLLNIGNEVGDNNVTAVEWKTAYAAGIKRMRDAGIKATIVVDAPGYGQKLSVIREAGLDLLAADPEKNLLFSVHTYWPVMWGWTDQKVKDELQSTVDKGIPFIIGEFGNEWEQNAAGAIPYKLILEECQRLGLGWLAWSWGPGNNPQTWLDMTTDGKFSSLRGWGLEVAQTLPTSIKNTSVRPASLGSGVCAAGIAKKPEIRSVTGRGNREMSGAGWIYRYNPAEDAGRDARGRRKEPQAKDHSDPSR
ncbi:MAG: cellulase family glycosylhydrolase [Fibrobacteria bacterium]